jgi:hypothetical protein
MTTADRTGICLGMDMAILAYYLRIFELKCTFLLDYTDVIKD